MYMEWNAKENVVLLDDLLQVDAIFLLQHQSVCCYWIPSFDRWCWWVVWWGIGAGRG
jgi:hypothetical protein